MHRQAGIQVPSSFRIGRSSPSASAFPLRSFEQDASTFQTRVDRGLGWRGLATCGEVFCELARPLSSLYQPQLFGLSGANFLPTTSFLNRAPIAFLYFPVDLLMSPTEDPSQIVSSES
jgi:hypothetical protein